MNWNNFGKACYCISAACAIFGIWFPSHIVGGLPGHALLWTSAVFVGLAALLRAEDYRIAIATVFTAGSIAMLAGLAWEIVMHENFSSPQASGVIAIALAVVVLTAASVSRAIGRFRD